MKITILHTENNKQELMDWETGETELSPSVLVGRTIEGITVEPFADGELLVFALSD